jgi:hypothetical protein
MTHPPRIGGLFFGYGGLDMAVQSVLGGELAWVSDVCRFNDDGTVGHYEPHRGACRVIEHRHPGVPNLGDITKIDWSQVEPVDILTGGSPCQDLSHAGKRAGMTEGTRSNLWVAMREAMQSGRIDYIDTPAQGNKRPDGVAWCADNGAFSDKFDEGKWWRFLEANAYATKDCAFAVAPDVVGDAAATLERSRPWLAKIRALGYPVAFVAQDGFESIDVPWDEFDCLFLGGSTEWKLGPYAREAVAKAKERGKWVHMGRVNSERRWRYADAIGCDSVDGTFLTFGQDTNLPKLLAWTRNNDQNPLFGASA